MARGDPTGPHSVKIEESLNAWDDGVAKFFYGRSGMAREGVPIGWQGRDGDGWDSWVWTGGVYYRWTGLLWTGGVL